MSNYFVYFHFFLSKYDSSIIFSNVGRLQEMSSCVEILMSHLVTFLKSCLKTKLFGKIYEATR